MRKTSTEFAEKGTYANVENVVASATCRQRIDLDSIVKAFPYAEYRPERFPGLIFKLNKPKTATLIFTSGKMICTGAKSKQSAKKAVLEVVTELRKRGIEVDGRPEIQIQNIVASGSLGAPVNIEESARVLDNTIYEPDQFPGLIYRMREPKVVMLIFSNGSIVCTGAKQESNIDEAVKRLRQILEENNLISIDQSKHALT